MVCLPRKIALQTIQNHVPVTSLATHICTASDLFSTRPDCDSTTALDCQVDAWNHQSIKTSKATHPLPTHICDPSQKRNQLQNRRWPIIAEPSGSSRFMPVWIETLMRYVQLQHHGNILLLHCTF